LISSAIVSHGGLESLEMPVSSFIFCLSGWAVANGWQRIHLLVLATCTSTASQKCGSRGPWTMGRFYATRRSRLQTMVLALYGECCLCTRYRCECHAHPLPRIRSLGALILQTSFTLSSGCDRAVPRPQMDECMHVLFIHAIISGMTGNVFAVTLRRCRSFDD